MDDMTHGELARWLERVEKKIDRSVCDHEKRLRRAERWLYMASGLALAGAGTGVGSVVSLLSGGGS